MASICSGTRLLVSRGLLVFAECQHPRRPVRRCGAEVDAPGTLALRVPLVDRERPALELERRRYAVANLQVAAERIMAVGMQVDEPGRDDQARDIDHFRATQGPGRDRRDLRAADPDIHHRVQARFRIHDPAVAKHQVVLDRLGRAGDQQEDRERKCCNRPTPGGRRRAPNAPSPLLRLHRKPLPSRPRQARAAASHRGPRVETGSRSGSRRATARAPA